MFHAWQRIRVHLVLVACSTLVAAAVGAEHGPKAGGPPPAYRFDDVGVSVQRQFGHGQPRRRVSLSGNGSASVERGGRTLPFAYPAKDLLAVLNELYGMRFFDLPTQLRPKASVFLKDDGTIGTQVLKMSDGGSTMLCFKVPGYEKCVSYETNGPRELEDLARRLFSEADKLAPPTPPAK